MRLPDAPRRALAALWAHTGAPLRRRWRAYRDRHPILVHGFIVWLRFAWRDLWLVVISAISAFAVIAAVDASDRADRSAARARALGLSNRTLLREQQVGRGVVIRLICDVDNDQNRALRVLIVSNARASKSFDDLYTARGLPGYEERLRQAKTAAKTLPKIDCDELAERGRAPTRRTRPPDR